MNKYYTKFTDDIYMSKKNIIQKLGKNYNELVWNNIKEYRFHYAHQLPVKNDANNKLYLVLTPKIMLKETNIIKKLSALSVYNHQYIDLSKRNPRLASFKDWQQTALLQEVISLSEIQQHPVTFSAMLDIINLRSTPSNEDELMTSKFFNIIKKTITNPEKKITINELIAFYKNLNSMHQVHSSNSTNKKLVISENFKNLINFLNLDCDYSFFTKAAVAFYAVKNNKFFDKHSDVMAFVLFYRVIASCGYQTYLGSINLIENCLQEKEYNLENAFQETTNYQGDITYLLNVFLDGAKKAISAYEIKMENLLLDYQMSDHKLSILENELAIKDIVNMNPLISYRQAKFFINHNQADTHYDLNHFRNFTKCSYETARYSMDNLVNHNFYEKQKIGKKFVYKTTTNLN